MNIQHTPVQFTGQSSECCSHHAKKHSKMPAEGIPVEKMPGHWLLARLGKRVLRPGGMETTHAMLNNLNIQPQDSVVEFAPGMGLTARMTTKIGPVSYIAVERDEQAAALLNKHLEPLGYACKVGSAEKTDLADGIASVVYGEAMLSMQTQAKKQEIIREAFRLLQPGGRYGIHELSVTAPEGSGVDPREVAKEITKAIHHGAQPLSLDEWKELLESEGFVVEKVYQAPMHLLEPQRILKDEGLLRTLKFFLNVLRDPEARARVKHMRATFKQYEENLGAVSLVCRKPA